MREARLVPSPSDACIANTKLPAATKLVCHMLAKDREALKKDKEA